MKKFIKEYLNILATTAIGLVFLVASFYLVINYYHSEELKRPLYVGQNDINYLNYQDKLSRISDNLKKFQNRQVKNTELQTMYNKLVTCENVMKSNGTLATIGTDNYFSPVDVYEMGSKFQSELLNICWAIHLSYITTENAPERFSSIAPYVVSSIENVTQQTNFALAEVQSNSSYFYTTNITSSTIRNYLSADYTMIAKSYNEFASIILNLSEELNKDSATGGVGNE